MPHIVSVNSPFVNELEPMYMLAYNRSGSFQGLLCYLGVNENV